ncbi:TIGR03915 family putative DNA repair protein [Paenibacillus sp. YN15]|uniref:TIGR03915 family putative DNA repair protein n=1 Tax=Paenibacillus sp. YN15 TaxID=1742774 RepID=UPI000DCEDECE|nr:TIGR03915 family putative DNA repair protein [Paenibacillus sp. YN15]RAV02035.1 DNA metabolism protein [Paenibacillus sp. YN15]
MSYRTDVAYSYDGSFNGFLCCVYESYNRRELPYEIVSQEEEQGFLLPARPIATDLEKAKRVYGTIALKISREAREMVRLGWLTSHSHKELLLLRFLRLGFSCGAAVIDMLADDTVRTLDEAVLQLRREAHKFTGFVRFSVHQGALVSIIEPRNQVLPEIRSHFCDRFASETFMIYDKTHRQALIHEPGRDAIVAVDELDMPELDHKEVEFRRLWKRFYNTIAIRERINPRRRMNFMPKRYWGQLPEMQPDSGHTAPARKKPVSRASELPIQAASLTVADSLRDGRKHSV